MIGGNKTLTFQVVSSTKNSIGEDVKSWPDVQSITGWLDYTGGTAGHSTYSAKIQESTHVFVSDYYELDASITAETSRAIVDGKRYDVVLIDNPMELNKQLEIYLKYTGQQI